MKKMIYFFAACFLSISAFAQSTNIIKNAQVFLAVRYPGIVPVDDNGNPLKSGPDSTYFMYVEISVAKPTWSYVWKGNKVYSVIATEVNRPVVEVGISKASGQTIRLRPTKNNTLWQLELVPFEGKKTPPLKTNAFLLQVKQGGKSYLRQMYKVTELEMIPSV